MELQIGYRGLTIGAGTDYLVQQVDGLFARSVAINTPDLPRGHGGLVGASYHDPRVVTLTFVVVGEKGADFAGKRNAVREAFQPLIDTEDPLVFEMPGENAQRIFARTSRFAAPANRESEAGGVVTAEFVVELIASDPVIYSDDEITVQADVFVSAEGINYPITYPTSYGAGGTGGGVNVMLGGAWESWATLTISGQTGTLTNPIIEFVTQGERLAFTAHGGMSMTNGQVFVIDTHPARRSAAFSTGQSRRGKLSADSVWTALQPGSNEIRFRASGDTTGAVLTIAARSATI